MGRLQSSSRLAACRQVRLKKVDRSRREAEAASNGQLYLPRRASHGAAGPSQVGAGLACALHACSVHACPVRPAALTLSHALQQVHDQVWVRNCMLSHATRRSHPDPAVAAGVMHLGFPRMVCARNLTHRLSPLHAGQGATCRQFNATFRGPKGTAVFLATIS